MDSIVVLDYGSQTTQLIVRRVREAHVYCELFPFDAPRADVMALDPKGFTGGQSRRLCPPRIWHGRSRTAH